MEWCRDIIWIIYYKKKYIYILEFKKLYVTEYSKNCKDIMDMPVTSGIYFILRYNQQERHWM